MNRIVWLSCALIVLSLAAWPARAQSNDVDPVKLAQACVAAATRIADHCVAANSKQADSAVGKIEKLLEEGKDRAARKVARHAIGHINRRSARCVARINHRCRHCVKVLLRLGEEELARRVAAVCREQADKVKDSRQASVARIRSAFPSDPGDGQ